jgi:DNA-binding NarL/FixJ family response regulator
LYLSVKTVESMLSRIYRKLQVRSRTELAKTMADWQPTAGGAGSC